MKELLYILARAAQILLGVVDLAMLARAILSWFIRDESKILTILAFITEPFIIPFRMLCSLFHWFEDSPIDVPFFLGFLFVGALNSFLPALTL